MDEEELQKRFTDCVYFLASPLTCKKGIECEYRHSEIARLNPRDCWYWLGGCCFNPDCAFRHPPLEGFKEAYYESSNLNNAPALPVDKTNIPCYFFSKGFCNKGEKCSFLHEPADVSKPSKPTPMVNNNPVPSEKKLSAESQTESPPVKSLYTSPETAQVDHTNTVETPTEDSLQEQSTEDSEEERSTEDTEMSNSLELEEIGQSESDVYNDQSSGFDVDVVVEGGESERVLLGYEQEDVVDYFTVNEEEEENPIIDYNPVYTTESGNGVIKERLNVYDRLDNKRKSIFYRLSFKKRNIHSQPVFKGRKGGHHDLREHLKKRKKVFDGGFGFQYCFSQGHDRNFRRYPQRKAVVPVKRYNRKPGFKEQKKRGFKEKGGGVFTGPKTLDEIKEEKKNVIALERKDGFEGPRPLSEILRNKKKFG